MPRLLRWVRQIPSGDRPKLVGYILNVINRTGGAPSGKVNSQQASEMWLRNGIMADLDAVEKEVLGTNPQLGVIPRLDVIARFLGEQTKFSRYEFTRKTSGQPTVEECLVRITKELLKRIGDYRAKIPNSTRRGAATTI